MAETPLQAVGLQFTIGITGTHIGNPSALWWSDAITSDKIPGASQYRLSAPLNYSPDPGSEGRLLNADSYII
jgi:hypothetical protein